jgi:tetratricopeptide (TPR) repeat protein
MKSDNEAIELTSRAVKLAKLGRLDEAACDLRRALVVDPKYLVAHQNLAIVLELMGDLDGAIASIEFLLENGMENAAVRHKLGSICAKQRRFELALGHFRTALDLDSTNASVHGDVGSALGSLGRHAEAAKAFREAITIGPACADFYAGLGLALAWTDEYAEAESCLRKALALEPQHATAHLNLAHLRKNEGQIDDAIAHYQQSLMYGAANSLARKGLAVCHFLKGDFERGWKEYEARIELGDVGNVHQEPLWDGRPIAGKTLVVETEQGVGDTIQFVRYLAAIKTRAACRVVLACEPSLVKLLTGIEGADEIIPQSGSRPFFDYWLPLLSVPHALGSMPDAAPNVTSYLTADPSRVVRWRERLKHVGGRRIGIAWQGNPAHPYDSKRSVSLSLFEPFARLPNVTLISLQKGYGSDQTARFPEVPVESLGDELDDGPDAFVDTAAVMQSLDLVISVDTSAAHLAGALGVPVWLALSHVPDWRWTLSGDATPWYPSMRLFRQAKTGDWESVFGRMAWALAANDLRAT